MAMPALFPWKPEYGVGLTDIDDQHRGFLTVINRLHRCERDELMPGLLEELAAYARFHFVFEENAMLLHGYPGLRDHAREHAELLTETWQRISALTPARRAELVMHLLRWFADHTAGTDHEFADWLRRKTPTATLAMPV